MLLELSDTTQEEAVLLLRSNSEILINIKNKSSTSLLLRAATPDSTSLLAEKPPSPLETYSQSTKSQKVPPSATSNQLLEIKDPTPDVQEPTPPSSDTPMTETRPE